MGYFSTSNLDTIDEDKFWLIAIDKEKLLLQLTWKKHPSSNEYRKGITKAYQYLIDYQIQYWVTDARKSNYLSYADQNWMINTQHPIIFDSSVKKYARVVSPEAYINMDSERLFRTMEEVYRIERGTRLEIFFDLETAYQWLFL